MREGRRQSPIPEHVAAHPRGVLRGACGGCALLGGEARRQCAQSPEADAHHVRLRRLRRHLGRDVRRQLAHRHRWPALGRRTAREDQERLLPHPGDELRAPRRREATCEDLDGRLDPSAAAPGELGHLHQRPERGLRQRRPLRAATPGDALEERRQTARGHELPQRERLPLHGVGLALPQDAVRQHGTNNVQGGNVDGPIDINRLLRQARLRCLGQGPARLRQVARGFRVVRPQRRQLAVGRHIRSGGGHRRRRLGRRRRRHAEDTQQVRAAMGVGWQLQEQLPNVQATRFL
mmetsp:Transcript_101867/g.285536  ORF Transcript_101867/g.285536 Transcript_101867/m.285536 type:complete len:292 (-) Transcript_101867:238-1113(-)